MDEVLRKTTPIPKPRPEIKVPKSPPSEPSSQPNRPHVTDEEREDRSAQIRGSGIRYEFR